MITFLVLDQCCNNNKQINTRASYYHSNITELFLLHFFKIQSDTRRFEDKKIREGVKHGGSAIIMNIFLGK